MTFVPKTGRNMSGYIPIFFPAVFIGYERKRLWTEIHFPRYKQSGFTFLLNPSRYLSEDPYDWKIIKNCWISRKWAFRLWIWNTDRIMPASVYAFKRNGGIESSYHPKKHCWHGPHQNHDAVYLWPLYGKTDPYGYSPFSQYQQLGMYQMFSTLYQNHSRQLPKGISHPHSRRNAPYHR